MLTEFTSVVGARGVIRPCCMSRLLAMILLLTSVIGVTGYWYYAEQKQRAIQTAREHVRGIGDLKAREISVWMKERQIDAATLLSDFLDISLQPLIISDPGAHQPTLNWMDSLAEHYGYSTVALLDTAGQTVLATNPVEAMDRSLIEQALQTRQVAFSDLYEDSKGLRLDFIVPLLSRVDEAIVPVGVLLLRIDPHRSLFPLLQNWPVSGPTAETVLVRREGDEVVLVTTLRQPQAPPLTLRLPLSPPHLPAGMDVRSHNSHEIDGIDYRGVEVLAAIRPVANSSWHIVAKVDRKAIEEPIRTDTFKTVFFIVVPILLVSLGGCIIWRRQSEQRIRESEARLRRLFEESPFPLLITRITDGTVMEANRAALDFFQVSSEQMAGMQALDFYFNPADHERLIAQLQDHGRVSSFDCQIKTRAGEQRWVILSAFAIAHYDEPAALIGFADINERKRLEDELRQFATIDSLTNALNRREFLASAEKELRRADRYSHPLSLLMIDVDHFKQINDVYGHSMGDKVLKTLAHALHMNLRDQDIFGRLGGEEFAVILPEVDQAGAVEVAERLLRLATEIRIPSLSPPLQLTISIGVAERIPADKDIEAILKRADKALYEAKHRGRNRVVASSNMGFPL